MSPGDELITVAVEHEPGAATATVRVSGEVDAGTAPELGEALERVIAAGATSVDLDLDGVQFLDSTGLTTLIAASTQLEGRGGVRVVVASEAVRRVLDVTGLDGLLIGPRGSGVSGSG